MFFTKQFYSLFISDNIQKKPDFYSFLSLTQICFFLLDEAGILDAVGLGRKGR